MRCVNLLVLLSLGSADATGQQQQSCGSGSSRSRPWCGASLLQNPKQGVGAHEAAVQDQLRGDFAETFDQLKFHELELEQLIGVERLEALAPAAKPEDRAAGAAASGKSRLSSGLLTTGEHEHVPGSAFIWTCGPTAFAASACGFFGGYVGFPAFAVGGILAVAIVMELLLSSCREPEKTAPLPRGAAQSDKKQKRHERIMSAVPGGNLSFAWQVRSCILFTIIVPGEIYVFYQTGMLQAAWTSAAPYFVVLIVLGTCFFPAFVSLGTCIGDAFEAIHERLDELSLAMGEVVDGAEHAWESLEEDVGVKSTVDDASKGTASGAAAAAATSKGGSLPGKKKKGCC